MSNNFIQIVENGSPLVKLSAKDFILEPMYFINGISESSDIYLREEIVSMLLNAQKKLPPHMAFKIWDGYRLLRVQEKLYNDLWDLRTKEHPEWSQEKLKIEVERFVGFPSRDVACPCQHNTGGAFDLTLIDESGKEIQMGTYFDEFHERSYASYFDKLTDPVSLKFRDNRKILTDVLCEAGFAPYTWEWWHFAFGNQHWATHYGKDVAIFGSLEL